VPTDNQSRITALRKLAKRLSKSHVVFGNRLEVIKARVPIVKFASVHGAHLETTLPAAFDILPARIPVDISINQTTGLSAVAVINRYLQHFPALRPLIMIIKLFLSSRGLNEVFKGGLGSYSIICMVISFMQVCSLFRSIVC
jgi:non-canonical poly(A) RNA polymerase PAPD5/7